MQAVAALGNAVDDVARAAWVFTMIGTLLAYRRRQRDADADPFPLIVRWTVVGIGFGAFLAVARAVIT